MADRVYHKLIAHLEETVSYGTLGVLDTLVNVPNKYDVLFINLATILRNNITKGATVRSVIAGANTDLGHLITTIRNIHQGTISSILYMDTKFRLKIPKESARPLIDSRQLLDDSVKKFIDFHTSPGKVKTIGENVFLYNPTRFAYEELINARNLVNLTGKTALISHCPIDFLLLTKDRSIDIIQSHTGGIINFKDLGKKVFGNEDTPFNKTNLMVFGDKDNLVPKITPANKKKLNTTDKTRLKTMNNLETVRYISSNYDVDVKDITWLK